jgi:hypothetical protein
MASDYSGVRYRLRDRVDLDEKNEKNEAVESERCLKTKS